MSKEMGHSGKIRQENKSASEILTNPNALLVQLIIDTARITRIHSDEAVSKIAFIMKKLYVLARISWD